MPCTWRLCAGGACWTLGRFHLTLWGPDAVFEWRLTGGRLVRRLNAWALMKVFLPKAWRCPPDFEISEAADRRMERLMSRRKETTWPWSGASLFPSAPATTYVGYGSVAESGLAQMEVVNDRKGRLPWTMEKEKL